MPSGVPNRNQTRDAFRLKEVEYLRKEIEYRTGHQVAIERDVLIAISIVYAGLATIQKPLLPELEPLKYYFFFIPFLIWLAGFARFMDDRKVIQKLGDYIAEREEQLDPGSGWENSFHRNKSSHQPRSRRAPSIKSFLSNWAWYLRLFFWGALGITTLAVPVGILWLRGDWDALNPMCC
jgi:hypothetical protein